MLIIPERRGGWIVKQQILFDLSDFTLILQSGIRMVGLQRQKTFLFAQSEKPQPSEPLRNVSLYGNGHVIDGNGAAMTFRYSHGDGSENDSAVRFNYVENLYVERVHATNGPIDSFSLRQCRNWIVRDSIFSASKEDNGASATTTWREGKMDADNEGRSGAFVNCTAFGNKDVGISAFNCVGVYFIDCTSHSNFTGYSYEDDFISKNSKRYFGKFVNCHAYNVVQAGFYIDADNVSVDGKCKTWNARGYKGDNSNDTFENGVIVANASNVIIDGAHGGCGRAGLLIVNGTGHQMTVAAPGRFYDNDGPGINVRGVLGLTVSSGAEVRGNGRVKVRGRFSAGIVISNNGGPAYLEGAGHVEINDVIIDGSGLGAFDIRHVERVDVRRVRGDNCCSGRSIGGRVQSAAIAQIYDCHLTSSRRLQDFAIYLDASVDEGVVEGSSGDANVALIINLSRAPH